MKVRKFQMGGEMAPAPAEQAAQGAPAGGSPEEQLAQVAMQIIEQMGPEAAAMLAQMIMEMLQGAEAPQEAPVYAKKGGKLVMIGRR